MAAPIPLLICIKRISGATVRDRSKSGFRREHSRLHRIVRAFDTRQVDESRCAADERAAGEGKFRHRLKSAFGDRARAIGDTFSPVQKLADAWVRFRALEFLEWRKMRIRI